ncbi:MAG: 2Fe-2S iron-sulfur cluster binding domain-containing protein [Rhodospirillales bacterium]|nr:2Fe-2S iron-sulfur cluster binding domain-containing protein [Rhodospirillales bacterium]
MWCNRLRIKNTTITVIRMADRIRFVLNDQPVEVDGLSPMTTLLDWLREHRGLRGTKEGCAEGDCGACTVVLERDGRREAMNSCIALLGQIDGQSVRTVEGLNGPHGAPHPVQTAMAESDATQCGFCTPGFVMSAYAFAAGGEKADLDTIHDALAGNLCRCTGYRPIVEAMTRVAGLPIEPATAAPDRAASATFGGSFHAPRSLAELLALRAKDREALLLAGATDLGLLASRFRKPPAAVIHLAHVPELTAVTESEKEVTIGAAASYAQAMPALIANYPALRTYLARLGSRQIRTMGTLGGNIGTASPIGDMPPVLVALEARLKLASIRGTRELIGRRLGAVEAVEHLLVMEAGAGIVDIAGDGEVENVTLRRLDAHGADQDQMGEIGGCHAGHLGGDPAAKARADEGGVVDLEAAQQAAMDHRDVAHAAHPVWPLRPAVAGMMRHQHVVVRRQGIVERQAVQRAGLMVQYHDGPRLLAGRTGAFQMQLGAARLDRGVGPAHSRHSGFPSLLERIVAT